MPDAYILAQNGTTEQMKRIHCKDEEHELQDILEKNYNLLPGDQIEPENPCRWLLIKREMPVPHPGSGANCWSVDLGCGARSRSA